MMRRAKLPPTLNQLADTFLSGHLNPADVLAHPQALTLIENIQAQATASTTIEPTVADNMLSTLVSGVIMLDSHGQCRYANPAACKILNLPLSDLLHIKLNEFDLQAYDDNDQPQPLPTQIALNTHQAIPYTELQIKCSTNALEVWLSMNAAPVFDTAGNFQGVVSSFQDIRSYKEANLALRQSEAYLRAILDNDSQSFLLLDLNHRFLMQNKLAYDNQLRIFNATAHIGQSMLDGFVLNQDRESFLRNFQTAASGQRVVVEKAFSTPNGIAHFEVRYNPVTTASGQVWAVSMTALDITKRKKDSEAIRTLSRIFQNATDPIILKNLQGTIIDLNHAVEETYGWQRQDLLNTSINKLIAPRYHHINATMLQRCLNGETVRNFETVWLNKDQQAHTVLLSLVLLQDDLGQAVGIASIGKDITALKKAQQAQKTALQQARTLQQAALALGMAEDLPHVLELILSELQKVVPYDSASVQVLNGQHFEIIAGRGFQDWPAVQGGKILISEYTHEQAIAAGDYIILDDIQAMAHNNAQSDFDIRSWMGIPLKFGEAVIGKLGIDKAEANFFQPAHAKLALAFGAQAAVALKNAQLLTQALEHRRHAETANQTKTRFLANISHELRTPLNAILGYTQRLQQDLTLLAKHQSAIDIIHSSSEQLLTMINNLLDLSTIENGHLEIKPAPFDLLNLLNRIKQIISLSAQEKGLAFHLILSPLLPQFVQGDENRLQQILLNLLSTTIKQSTTGQIILHIQPEEQYLSFHIFDTQDNITAAHQLLSPAPLNDNFNVGDKLNLHITQELITQMGGQLYLYHVLHKGVHYWFSLPLETPTSPPNRINLHQAYLSQTPTSGSVWLISQHRFTTDLIFNWLTQLNFKVHSLTRAKALSQAKEQAPPLITLLEVDAPPQTGLETLAQLRQLNAWQNSLIIGILNQPNSQLRAQCQEHGITDLLLPPIHFNHLLHLLQKHLHLTWPHHLEEAAPKKDSHLSPASRQTLLNLLEMGDIAGLQTHLNQLLSEEAHAAAFIEKLHHLLDAFELDTLEVLLKTQ